MQDLAQRQGLLTGGLFVLATVYTLYFAKALLMPIFLAVLVALVLRPVVRLLRRLYLPEALAAGLVILAIIMLLGWVILAIAEPASAWIDRGPLLRYQLEYKFETLLAPFEKVQEATKNIQDAASLGEDAKDTVVVEGPSLLHQLFLEVQSAFVNIMVIFVLVFFLLARGGWTYRRVSAAIEDDETREMWTDVLDDIRTNLAHYLLTISAINAGLGVLTAIAMQILGMPNALLWGVLAAVLNFIPYAGSLVTLAIITAVSVLTFDQWLTIMLPPLAFLFLTFLEGQLISPFVVGRRLTLDPIAVFISVLFWGWLWGFAGMLLAVPILASLKITIGAIESLAPLSAIIDSQGDEDLPVEV
jgi:predicted PurR-regulated permease PerM